jgi:hypothetical protein
MKTEKQITEFLESIELEYLNFLDYITPNEVEQSDAFNSIYTILEDKMAFDIEIIYYSEAMKYLSEYDASLVDSFEIAENLGIELKNLNSETLASIHASEKTRNDFHNHKQIIDAFFS